MSRFWLLPPSIMSQLNKEFQFDFDPCPYPRPLNFDGILENWGKMNYVNPPFRRTDGNIHGPTDFVRKAILEKERGNSSVLLLPTQSYVNLLIEAGAQVRSMGRIKWLDAYGLKNCNNPSPITCFILKP